MKKQVRIEKPISQSACSGTRKRQRMPPLDSLQGKLGDEDAIKLINAATGS
jgi:hypothetical protein